MSYINWNIKYQDEYVVKKISNEIGCSDTFSRLLYNRGLINTDDVQSFLHPSNLTVHDPFLLNDMDIAVKRIYDAINENEKICIYGDYDVDGITSVSVLYLFLKRFTDNVSYYIPDRFSQGYGVNTDAINKIKNNGCDLIITVDTGISAFEEIKLASKLGIDVIVTDHHECQQNLPEAIAVINPKRKDNTYPFTKLAGVGVVYKFLCALDKRFDTSFANDYIDLVAIGTIADIMPLLDENRFIVKQGINKISESANKGLKCLMDICIINHTVTSQAIGYAIAPRINAAGRMDSAELAVKLFTVNDKVEIERIANQLCELNLQRQKIENDILNEAVEIIEKHELNQKYSVLVLWNKGWHNGVIGIVASKLKERYNKPVILFSVDDVAKGSGRSVAPFNLYNAFENNKDILIQFGGHKYAAGVLIENDRLYEFRDKMSKCMDNFLSENTLKSDLDVECVVPHDVITYKTATDISLLQPFGKNNEVPLFCIKNVRINDLFSTSNNRHLRIKFSIGDKLITGFYFSVDISKFDYREGDVVDVICEINENEYKNYKNAQLTIKDLRYNQQTIDSYTQRRKMCDMQSNVIPELLPTRHDIAVVYRFLHQSYLGGRKEYNLDTLSNIINKDCLVKLNYEKMYYSLCILMELGIVFANINKNDLFILDIIDGKKFSLSDSTLLMSIYNKAGVRFGN